MHEVSDLIMILSTVLMGYGVKGRMVRSIRLARDRDPILNQQTEKQNQEDKKQTVAFLTNQIQTIKLNISQCL